jgi:hypothetical protein
MPEAMCIDTRLRSLRQPWIDGMDTTKLAHHKVVEDWRTVALDKPELALV